MSTAEASTDVSPTLVTAHELLRGLGDVAPGFAQAISEFFRV